MRSVQTLAPPSGASRGCTEKACPGNLTGEKAHPTQGREFDRNKQLDSNGGLVGAQEG